jgi:hypothetical protein
MVLKGKFGLYVGAKRVGEVTIPVEVDSVFLTAEDVAEKLRAIKAEALKDSEAEEAWLEAWEE